MWYTFEDPATLYAQEGGSNESKSVNPACETLQNSFSKKKSQWREV